VKLEEKQVLLTQRFNPFVSSKEKEWWYTGISDPDNNIFLGFSVIRVMFMDSISVTLFDPERDEALEVSWKGFLDKEIPPGQLYLKAHNKKISFSYTGSEEEGWHFSFQSPELSADLAIQKSIPHFTKFDNYFVDDYMLLHYFMNRVNGSIQTKEKTYTVNTAQGYLDHCAGTVPGKTKWHWIAVQNKNCALASLMNYGVYPQCYTQSYFAGAAPEAALNRWIRLDQDVSFESYHKDRFNKSWRISSPDMFLKCKIIQTSLEHERIPPLIPFLVKLDHYQCSVEIEGCIRVDGSWIETGPMHGVLEEHYGNW